MKIALDIEYKITSTTNGKKSKRYYFPSKI